MKRIFIFRGIAVLVILLGLSFWWITKDKLPEDFAATPASPDYQPVIIDEPSADQPVMDSGDKETDSSADTTEAGDDSASLPRTVLLDVPFLAQAPYGDWSDPRQQDGCEEASLSMVSHWRSKQTLTRDIGLAEILGAWDWQVQNLGAHPSLSADDTVRLAKGYFDLETGITIERSATIASMKKSLAVGNALVVPLDGRLLGNPNYTAPGPPEHMLVVIGYDEARDQFITNDPGTRQGKLYRYNTQVFFEAMREYPTGHREPIEKIHKVFIAFSAS